MFRNTRTLDKVLGSHARQAWTTLDNALQHFTETTSTPFSPTLSPTATANTSSNFSRHFFPEPKRTNILHSVEKLLKTFGTGIPDRIRRRLYDEILITLDDVVYYLANQSTLMVFTDERKYGETPTTPRSIPPAEHLFNTLSTFRDAVQTCHDEWMEECATSKMKRKLATRTITKHMDLLTTYAAAITNKKFVTWLCNDDSKEVHAYRSEIAGHLRCTLLQLSASEDPGSHTIRGGFCCRVSGCRRSAARQGICVGHALEELSDMSKLPSANTFLTNPIHRSCVLKWFIGKCKTDWMLHTGWSQS